MPRARTGSPTFKRGTWRAQLFVRKGLRVEVDLGLTDERADEKKAKGRAALLAELAGHLGELPAESCRELLRRSAVAPAAKVRKLIKLAAEGKLEQVPTTAKLDGETTFAQVAVMWTSGELARRFPHRKLDKKTGHTDASRFRRHILPVVGDVPISAFDVEHADRVMAKLPRRLKQNSRANIGRLINRVMVLAVHPLRLIKSNPLPPGWAPPAGDTRDMAFLYPREEAALLACGDIPFRRRFAYGLLAREGCRRSETLSMRFDLDVGAVVLDRNKTKDARAWRLNRGVAEALRVVSQRMGRREVDAIMYTAAKDISAEQLREDLKLAGIDRPELFADTPERRPFEVHGGLRGTFITLSLAAGRNETWVIDRTGHKSSRMVETYRRKARLVTELDLGELLPLHLALPEVQREVQQTRSNGGDPGPKVDVDPDWDPFDPETLVAKPSYASSNLVPTSAKLLKKLPGPDEGVAHQLRKNQPSRCSGEAESDHRSLSMLLCRPRRPQSDR